MDNNDASQLSKETVQELNEIKTLLRKAKKQLEAVQEFNTQFEVLREKLTNPQSGVSANVDSISQASEKIQGIKSLVEQTLNDTQNNKQQIENLLSQANNFISRLQDLVKQGESNATTTQNIITDITGLKEKIDGLKKTSEEKATTINQKYEEILGNLDEMQKAYTSFREIKSKIDDPNEGLEAILNLSHKLKDDITQTRTNTEDSYKQSKTLEEKVKAIKNQSDKAIGVIESNSKKSEEYKNQIGEILEVVTDTSVGDSFNQRKKEITQGLGFWLYGLAIAIILLTGAISILVWMAYDKNGLHIDQWRFWYRFALTSPLIYAVYFFSRNYSRERELLERYAFKFSLSLSLRSYVQLLTDNFKSEEAIKNAQNFTLKTLDIVYKEPYLEKNKKYAFGINKIFNIGIEENDVKEIEDKILGVLDEKVKESDKKP